MLRYKKIGVLLIFTLIFSFSAVIFQVVDRNGIDDKKYYPITNSKDESLQSSSIDPINLSLFEDWNLTEPFFDRYNEELLVIENIEGYNVSLNCVVKNLRNRTSAENYYPEAVSLSLYQHNSTNWTYIGAFSDISNGSGYINIDISIPKNISGYFAIGSIVNVTFDIFFTLSDNNTREIQAIYQENRWIINYNSSYITGNYTSIISNLSSALDLELIRGFNGVNWRPIIQYQFLENLSIFESFSKYLIEFSVQILDVSYDNYLEVGDNLGLYIVPKIDGNLTINFTGVNDESLRQENIIVEKNELIKYSWVMNSSYPGGIGKLIIEFKGSNQFNVSRIESEITFYKHTDIYAELFAESGYSTRALEIVGLLAYYVDKNNNTIVPDGLLEYSIGNFSGKMDYIYKADITGNSSDDEYIYIGFIDLSELRLKPGNYTVELMASKPGYESANFYLPLEITRIFCNISTPLLLNNHIDIFINEPFELDLDLLYEAWTDTWINIQEPVNLTFTIYNSNWEEIGSLPTLDTQFADPEIKGIIGSGDTYPGDYFIEVAVESSYYFGRTNISLTIKNDLKIFLMAPSNIAHPDVINLKWISDGLFFGDKRGHVLILIDGIPYGIQPLLPISFQQIDSNDLSAGQHVIQVLIQSDYYTGQIIRTINIELSFWEKYGVIILTVIGIIAIALLVMAGYQRRKKKLKRNEWASLGAMMAIKDGMNMFTIRRSKKSKYSYELSADENLFTGMIEAIKNFAKEINLSSGDTTRFQGDQGMITIIPENNRRFNLVFLSQDELKNIESDLRTIFLQSFKRYYDVHVGDWTGDLSVFKIYLNKAERLINSDSIAKAKKMGKKEKVYEYEIQS
jgi:hypothetical protein